MYTSAFVNLYTTDIEAGLRFYRDLLGFKETFRTPTEGTLEHVELRLNDFELGLGTVEAARRVHGVEPSPGSPAMVLVVWTDDVDVAFEVLIAAGAPVVQPPHDTGSRNRNALLRDPDGNLVEIVATRRQEQAMEPASIVELAQAKRRDAVSTLVSAFIVDPVERWLYPTSSDYLAHFGRFVEAFAGRAFEARTAWSVGDCAAVALWLPPGTNPDGDAIALVISDTVAAQKHSDTFEVLEQMAAAHPTYPHWYLALMGVDPADQGHGLGSRLLAEGLRRVDADHLPAYLETPNLKAVPLYERHGFVVSGRAQAGTCPPIVSMVRPAR